MHILAGSSNVAYFFGHVERWESEISWFGRHELHSDDFPDWGGQREAVCLVAQIRNFESFFVLELVRFRRLVSVLSTLAKNMCFQARQTFALMVGLSYTSSATQFFLNW